MHGAGPLYQAKLALLIFLKLGFSEASYKTIQWTYIVCEITANIIIRNFSRSLGPDSDFILTCVYAYLEVCSV